ncbi:Multiple epidermal growth factor-like domains protein 6 [Bagarius yarrelli]|uniref:Multiple epidermal growth factor-like domains protein 6 n=1 Tax=Bagarius yarrelli TaxID=175774 RepID=A0A556V779_BAGYA|nr:Multiple epidermal growth factor-like domains protein 6 [Bagarius yarrelli]
MSVKETSAFTTIRKIQDRLERLVLICLNLLSCDFLSFSYLPDVNECENSNGGCEGTCCNTIGSFYCKCPEGSTLGPDAKTCHDTDECDTKASCCQHDCRNYPGGYECSCNPGYTLGLDGCSCNDENDLESNEEQFEVLRFPDLLFRRPPQLLHYSAALHTPDDPDDTPRFTRVSLQLIHFTPLVSGPQDVLRAFSGHSVEDAVTAPIKDAVTVCMEAVSVQQGFMEDSAICEEEVRESYSEQEEEVRERKSEQEEEVRERYSEQEEEVRERYSEQEEEVRERYSEQEEEVRESYSKQKEEVTIRYFMAKERSVFGLWLDKACPRWTFGTGCSHDCDCVQENSLGCNARNGTCTCRPGYHGDRCQAGCPAGSYGQDCAKVCVCGEGGQCHPVSGKCNCTSGRTGHSCGEECESGGRNAGERLPELMEMIIICESSGFEGDAARLHDITVYQINGLDLRQASD